MSTISAFGAAAVLRASEVEAFGVAGTAGAIVEDGEVVGRLPVDRGGGPRGGGPGGVEVGDQPFWFDADQVERIVQEVIEPTRGTTHLSITQR